MTHQEKGVTSDTCNYTDEPQICFAGQTAAGIKKLHAVDSTELTFWKSQNLRDREEMSGQEARGELAPKGSSRDGGITLQREW